MMETLQPCANKTMSVNNSRNHLTVSKQEVSLLKNVTDKLFIYKLYLPSRLGPWNMSTSSLPWGKTSHNECPGYDNQKVRFQ